MGGIVDELSSFARPAQGLAVRRVAPAALAADVLALHEGLAAQREIDLRLETGATGEVVADPRKLTQVLVNLIQNALDAVPARGRVVLRVAPRESGGVTFTIDDDGPGLAPEMRERLFVPGATTKAAGNGLGLRIARAIAQQHGGTLTIGDAPGGGCRAMFDLPTTPPGDAPPMTPTAPPAPPGRVLVVDDDAGVRYTLCAILEAGGHTVESAPDGATALRRLQAGGLDLVLTDLRMPGLDGFGLLEALAELPGAPRAIVVTAHGSERVAVEAMKRGALDYFAKPFDADEIMRVVGRALETVTLARDNARLRAARLLARTMVFDSPAMERVAERVERAAGRDVTVLITGESGTGKELVARALVRGSSRAERPYLRFNCAALPRELAEAELFGHSRGAFTGAQRARAGLFREAAGGTVLLDEIGELDPSVQGALLRVLQEREVRPVGEDRAVPIDVRILAATNRNLAIEVEQGRFRQDLFYRLNVVTLHVPPLRERPRGHRPARRALRPPFRGTLRHRSGAARPAGRRPPAAGSFPGQRARTRTRRRASRGPRPGPVHRRRPVRRCRRPTTGRRAPVRRRPEDPRRPLRTRPAGFGPRRDGRQSVRGRPPSGPQPRDPPRQAAAARVALNRAVVGAFG
jgi:CheY-like chemotaxis protein